MAEKSPNSTPKLCLGFEHSNKPSTWYIINLPSKQDDNQTTVSDTDADIESKKNSLPPSFQGTVAGRNYFTCASRNSTLYLVGGMEGPIPCPSVLTYDHVVNSDGKLNGTWKREAGLICPRDLPLVVNSYPCLKNSSLYVFGSVLLDRENYASFVRNWGEVLHCDVGGGSKKEWCSIGAPKAFCVESESGNRFRTNNIPLLGGFVNVKGETRIVLILAKGVTSFCVERGVWEDLPDSFDEVFSNHMGQLVRQTPVVDDVWFSCDKVTGVVYGVDLGDLSRPDFDLELGKLSSPKEVEGVSDPSIRRSRYSNHSIIQIAEQTLCLVCLRQATMETSEKRHVVKCVAFQVVKESNGTLHAANKATSIHVLEDGHPFSIVLLEEKSVVPNTQVNA